MEGALVAERLAGSAYQKKEARCKASHSTARTTLEASNVKSRWGSDWFPSSTPSDLPIRGCPPLLPSIYKSLIHLIDPSSINQYASARPEILSWSKHESSPDHHILAFAFLFQNLHAVVFYRHSQYVWLIPSNKKTCPLVHILEKQSDAPTPLCDDDARPGIWYSMYKRKWCAWKVRFGDGVSLSMFGAHNIHLCRLVVCRATEKVICRSADRKSRLRSLCSTAINEAVFRPCVGCFGPQETLAHSNGWITF